MLNVSTQKCGQYQKILSSESLGTKFHKECLSLAQSQQRETETGSGQVFSSALSILALEFMTKIIIDLIFSADLFSLTHITEIHIIAKSPLIA